MFYINPRWDGGKGAGIWKGVLIQGRALPFGENGLFILFSGKDFLEGREIEDSGEVPMHHLKVGWGSNGDLNQRRTLDCVFS